MRIFRHLLLAATLALGAGASHAITVGPATNNPFAFVWDFTTPALAHLTGNGSISVSGFNSNLLTVTVTLTNTSAIGGQGGDRLTAFGFGIDPNATSIGFSDGSDGGMVDAGAAQGSLASNVAGIEVCAWGGNNCNGGGNGGILGQGGSDTFQVLLGGTWGSSVTIDPIGFKYQTGAGSFEFGCCGTNTSTSSGIITSGHIPEPQSAALVGLSLCLLGLGFKRRRQAA